MKKISIFFTIIILGLGTLGPNICWAVLNAPTNPETLLVGEISANLSWQWAEPTDSTEGEIHRFEISYRKIGITAWTTPSNQPDGTRRSWPLMGLEELTSYEWTIMAKAIEESNNSTKIPDPPATFTTTQAPVPPPEENGNGWWSGPIALENPLKQDNIWDATNAVLNFLTLIAFIIAPVLIIYSAFLMIFATGDAVKINKAKAIITWTLVALAIILFAKGLPLVIKEAMGG